MTPPSADVTWVPPPEGTVKINVDAGISVDHNLGAATAICRDREVSYLGSPVLVIHGLLDPATVEAVACRDALALAQDLGMQRVVVSSDCKQAVHHIEQAWEATTEASSRS